MITQTSLKLEASVEPEAPPLMAGDHLSRGEFHRRYLAATHLKKAELIEGVVYMPSPVSLQGHGIPHLDIATWIGTYEAHTPGVQAGDNVTVLLDEDNEFQPDVFLRILPEFGGQSSTENDYVRGAPELIVEVAASSASYDLHSKLNAYRRNGVKEYVVWQSWEKSLTWFVLRSGRYEPAAAHFGGCFRSETFAGLWLDVNAMFQRDRTRVLEALQQGLASAEHAQFVQRLAASRQ